MSKPFRGKTREGSNNRVCSAGSPCRSFLLLVTLFLQIGNGRAFLCARGWIKSPRRFSLSRLPQPSQIRDGPLPSRFWPLLASVGAEADSLTIRAATNLNASSVPLNGHEANATREMVAAEKKAAGTKNSSKLPGRRLAKKLLTTPKVEVISAAFALISSFLVAVQTLSLTPVLTDRLRLTEDVISWVFAVEFLIRWWSKGLKPTRLLQPFMIVDFLSFLPLLLRCTGFGNSIPRLVYVNGLTFLRLLRILRLQRVLRTHKSFARFQAAMGFRPSDFKPYQLQLARVCSSILTLLSITSGVIYTAEHDVNPMMPDYFTALYFTLITLTTVGFGDITPVTPLGRLAVCVAIFAGISIIPLQLSSLAESMLGKDGFRSSSPLIVTAMTDAACQKCLAAPHRADARYCWRCGKRLEEGRGERERESS